MEFAEVRAFADRSRSRQRHNHGATPKTRTAGWRPKSLATGPRGRFLRSVRSAGGRILVGAPKRESKSALSGEASRQPVG
jgi:hypothetical protein